MKREFDITGENYDSFSYTSYGETYDDCFFNVARYPDNGTVAIGVTSSSQGSICTITVYLDYAGVAMKNPEDDMIAIKDYSENEGIVDAMIRAGLIEEEPLYWIQSSFVNIPIMRLSKSFAKYIAERLKEFDNR